MRDHCELVTGIRPSKLFLANCKPFKSISTSTTFANWTLELMKSASIDTNKFKTHSTRSAVASKQKKTMSLDQILKCADWSNARTFLTFYDHQVVAEAASTSHEPTSEDAVVPPTEEETDPTEEEVRVVTEVMVGTAEEATTTEGLGVVRLTNKL